TATAGRTAARRPVPCARRERPPGIAPGLRPFSRSLLRLLLERIDLVHDPPSLGKLHERDVIGVDRAWVILSDLDPSDGARDVDRGDREIAFFLLARARRETLVPVLLGELTEAAVLLHEVELRLGKERRLETRDVVVLESMQILLDRFPDEGLVGGVR